MEYKFFIGFLLYLITFTHGLPHPKADLMPFALDDVIGSSKFSTIGVNATWISDTEFLYTDHNFDLNIWDLTTDTWENVLVAEDYADLGTFSYSMSPDRTIVLLRYSVRQVFRHSTLSKYKIVDVITKVVTDFEEGDDIQLVIWAPVVGSNFAFVKENDVYHYQSGVVRRLTYDGIPGVIFNGVPDWVYEEEAFKTYSTLWFSPDATKIAIVSFDDTNVETFTFHMYGEPGSLEYQYPVEVNIRYPKVSTTNPTVKLSFFDLTDPAEEWKVLPVPVDRVTDSYIISAVAWANNDNILAVWQQRRQQFGSVQLCSTDTLLCEEMRSFEEPNGWIESPVIIRCSPDSNKCFYLNNLDNWRHIGSISIPDGNIVNDTSGNYWVVEYIGYRSASDDLFYAATTTTNSNHRHIYKNDECLTCNLSDPEGNICTYATATFSKDFTYYMVTCRGPSVPFTTVIQTETNEAVSLFYEPNNVVRELLTEYQSINIRYLSVPVGDGFQAAVKLFLPEGLDLDTVTAEKYPMIVDVYAGPTSVRVWDSFSIGFPNYLITSHKVIYAHIDGRGTANKGADMMYAVLNRLGTVEVEDQITVTKYLQDTYSFIDANRTGIWGWSYGGYSTAMAISKDIEHLYKCGISVAPVSAWIFYDTIHTERYMGFATDEDNLEGYNNSDVSRRAEEFRGRDFMIIHGTADDNVHYQHAMSLVRALQLKDIMFEQMSYPDEAHGLIGVSRHLYHTMDLFWRRCLEFSDEEL